MSKVRRKVISEEDVDFFSFNMNDHVYVKMNDKGWAHLLKVSDPEYVNLLKKDYMVEIEGVPYLEFQMHELFSLFGSRSLWSSAFTNPFSLNILFDKRNISEFAPSGKSNTSQE